MKKYTFPLALILALSFPLVIYAQGMGVRAGARMNTASSTAGVEMKARAEARQASSTERRLEMQQGMAQKKVEQTARVLSATIVRLEKILERVESRIAKVKEAGGDTAASEASALEVKGHLAKARASLEAFLEIKLTALNYQENFGLLRDSAAEVKMHLREARTSLMKTVRDLKASAEVEASTSTN